MKPILPIVALLVFVAVPPLRAVERRTLHGHVPAAVASTAPLGRLLATNRLHLAIGLPLRNPAALSNLLARLYDPASPDYRRFLTPEQFAERFGPTEADYQAVEAFAAAYGFAVSTTHPNRLLLDVKGTVGDIERAFGLTMRLYRHPKEGRTFYAPDAEPSVDTALPILQIAGLDNASPPRPLTFIRQRLTASPAAVPAPNAGSGPSGLYRGGDFRAAYVPDTSLTGAGQSIGLVQFDGYYASDIATYEKQASLPSVTLTNVLLDGFNGQPTTDTNAVIEVSLDIEMAISMASGLSRVIVYEAPNDTANAVDILNRMATDNLAKQLSCSWGWGGGPIALQDQIFQNMAAQGQSFFAASGDGDAYEGSTSIMYPSDSACITTVGGTTLSTTGGGGSWVSETVWNLGNGTGSGGGISTSYAIPSWQQGINMGANAGSTTMRNVPDVALTADQIYVIAANGIAWSVGGTSCAAPLWAGFMALVNQQAVASGQPPVGFVNPIVYSIGKGSSYAACFHDTTTGNNVWPSSPSKFYAVSGYDLCTGWGTPAGTNLINAMAETPASAVTNAGMTLLSESFVPTNGVVDPGETVTVSLGLRNNGAGNTSNLVATLLATNGVTVPSGPQTYGVVPTSGVTVAHAFSFTANGALGSTIHPTLQLQDGARNLGTVNYAATLGTFVSLTWTENFDTVTAPALPPGWTTTNWGAEAKWITTNSAIRDTAPNAAFVNDAASTGLSELVSVAIPLVSPVAQLSFRNNYNLQSIRFSSALDGGVLEIGIGTNAFVDITNVASFVSNGYNMSVSSSSVNPLRGRMVWSGNAGGFVTTVANLPVSAAGQNIRLKWRCGSDDTIGDAGWYIDTVAINDGYYIASAGRIAVAPASLDFGTVAGGAVSQRVFAVGNTGGTAVTNVTVALQTAGGPFSLPGPPNFDLPVYGATNVTVRFAPVVGGTFSNAVVFATANGGSATNGVTGRAGTRRASLMMLR